MKTEKTRARILLLAALALAASGMLLTETVGAFGHETGTEWLVTPAAAQKQQAGDCGSSLVCRELCYYGTPQGDFDCFPN